MPLAAQGTCCGTDHPREQYVPRGWRAQDARNYSLLLSSSGELAIQVATGNEAAGDPRSPFPRLAHPKGEMTEQSVRRNAQQLNLFTGDTDDEPGGSSATSSWPLSHETRRIRRRPWRHARSPR